MNTKIPLLFLGLSLAVAPRLALFAGQSFPLTAQTVNSWIVTGADQSRLAEATLVVLPAGAQLARNFGSGDIAINLDAGIVFGTDPVNWPVLEISSAALVFGRNGDEGFMKLILGDKDPIALPYVFKLDENGHSIEPVQLTFALSGGMVAVSAQQRTMAFPAEFAAGTASEVVISAGGANDLALANFEVVLGGNNTSIANSSGSLSGSGKGNSSGNSGVGLITSVPAGASDTNSGNAAKDPDAVTTAPVKKVGLVVFSASAFRLGRADSIRASAISTAAKQK